MPDLINRGVKRPTPLGSSLFFILRSLDSLLQYKVLANGLGDPIIRHLGGSVRAPAPPLVLNGFGSIINVGLSLHRTILVGMAAGCAAKQIYWLLGISEEEFPVFPAVAVSAYNTLFNSINSLLFLSSATSSLGNGDTETLSTPLLIGTGLYVTGILLELVSEIQRRNFKRDKRNAGKPYTEGLFGWARHINYFGYTLWRAGISWACGGWKAGLVAGTYLAVDFVYRAVPVLDKYCTSRYGETWLQYKSRVPYKVIPGIW
ncbi:erg4 erg24 ergosterol biosynthesis-like protein [Moniliophthora roreri MCA 2997]|uniref:Erg4 erg24 ergosterol biosynthesis-like protein n=1 Tax=Moniliophthora roreri (strain MCA 2997) TaxID=1381753 RepID=V2W8U9_MONRO|nr:erg4 erg24 ergosterol biosynthesis-like protein [Moniliophthora roreri MCA 2997]